MKKIFKYWKVLFPALIALVIFTLWLIGYMMALDYNFNGMVQKVSYDEKHIPTVTINNINYELGYNNWGHYQDTIEVGDSMIKKSGETYIKLIKRNKRRPVKFLRN